GKIAAPALARSQAAGSVIQGIGYALYEARETDAKSGHVLTTGMEDYRIPGIADTPEIDVHFDEAGYDHVMGGSVGIGEVATAPPPSARSRPSQRSPPTSVSRTPIPASPPALLASPRRRSATSPRSAAISRSARAAGIFATRTSPA